MYTNEGKVKLLMKGFWLVILTSFFGSLLGMAVETGKYEFLASWSAIIADAILYMFIYHIVDSLPEELRK
jgi:hypothetical protein